MARNRDNVEAPVTDEAATQQADQTTDTTEATPAQPEAPKVDLEAVYNSAVQAGVEAAEGMVVPDGHLSSITEAYKALRGRARERALQSLGAGMMSSIEKGDVATAQVYGSITKALQNVVSQPVSSAPTVDPATAHATQVFVLAQAAALAGTLLPEGVTSDAYNEAYNGISVDADEIVAAYKASGDEAQKLIKELSPTQAAILRLLQGKGSAKVRTGSTGATRTYNGGPRRNITEVVLDVLQTKPGVAFRVNEIVKVAHERNHGVVSSGAISNAIKKGIDGVSFTENPLAATYNG